MNCSLTLTDRNKGTFCRGFSCTNCRDYKELKESYAFCYTEEVEAPLFFDSLKNRIKLYSKLSLIYSREGQLVKAIEELSELNVELARLSNGSKSVKNPEHIFDLVDELTDAGIMIEQTILNYGLFEDVRARREVKLTKLSQRSIHL